ncbi:MAG: serine hydrolase domain-containing protein [Acidobacteriota bacterium]
MYTERPGGIYVSILLVLLCALISTLQPPAAAAVSNPPGNDEAAGQAYPHDERSARADQLFEPWDRRDSPGAALGIFKDGRIIYARGYGMANLEYHIPITPSTVFRVGSVSKQFTAMAVSLLAQSGKISLDDDIRKYLPELPDYGRPITIRHLIHHTSGIRDYLTLQFLGGRDDDYFYTPQEVIDLLARQEEVNFTPGDKFLYSNSGYFLLAEIVARASGMKTRDFAAKKIFEPLEMSHTHFHDQRNRIVRDRASGYAPEGNGYRIDMTQLEMIGDGRVFTTVEDMFRWDQNFYDNKLGNGGPELIDTILTRGRLNDGTRLDYAFGLTVSTYRGERTIGHGGSFVGFRAAYLQFPDYRFSVVVLANLSTVNPSRLCRSIADIYLEDQFTEPVVEESPADRVGGDNASGEGSELTATKLREYAGDYFSNELQVTYRLRIQDGKLLLAVRTMPEALLTPVSVDQFRVDERRLQFLRDGDGKVSGFTLQAGRVRNLKFERRTPKSLSAHFSSS